MFLLSSREEKPVVSKGRGERGVLLRLGKWHEQGTEGYKCSKSEVHCLVV